MAMEDVNNPESLRVLAFFKAKAGRASELQTILLSLVEPTRSEPGSISYILHTNESDPHFLMFDEIWANRRTFEEHLQKPYIQSLLAKIEHLIEEHPRIEVYLKVPR